MDEVELGFDVMTPEEKAALTSRLRGGVSERTPGISVDTSTRVLAVASGKGGVGKSSLAANLAAAFSRLGQRTGVLDADVYGYSIPHMLGIHQRPVAVDGGERAMIVPPVRDDLKVMSIGFFLDENTPVMWRGPMLHRALEQFLSDVHWGELDTLVVDMPPGTGDVAISLGQLLPRAEAVVVTTPHRASQQVAVRAAQMARKTNMRLLGVVENMAYLLAKTVRARSSSARAAARRWRRRWRRRSSAGSPSTRAWARSPTKASRSCGPSPRPTSPARSSSSPRRSPPRAASRESASSSRSRSSTADDPIGARVSATSTTSMSDARGVLRPVGRPRVGP